MHQPGLWNVDPAHDLWPERCANQLLRFGPVDQGGDEAVRLQGRYCLRQLS